MAIELKNERSQLDLHFWKFIISLASFYFFFNPSLSLPNTYHHDYTYWHHHYLKFIILFMGVRIPIPAPTTGRPVTSKTRPQRKILWIHFALIRNTFLRLNISFFGWAATALLVVVCAPLASPTYIRPTPWQQRQRSVWGSLSLHYSSSNNSIESPPRISLISLDLRRPVQRSG